MNVIATAAGPVELGAAPVRVTLTPTAAGKTLASLLAALGPDRHVSLVLRDLRTGEPPNVLYHLDLDLPPGAQPGKDESRHVGVLNFYAVVPGAPANSAFVQSYDLTSALRALRARGALSDRPTVTFYPVGTPAAGAKAVIGRIELVVQ
jgi:hypothetical protein